MAGIPVGIVGAGRTRNGLGPFLAAHCETAGLRVVGVAGRDGARTRSAAAALGERLGHPVLAHDDVAALAQSGIAALVVASPAEHHLAALAAALAARVHCLCEKPLVPPGATAAARTVVAGFATRGLLLVENCQWPFVLPAFDRLFPGVRQGGVAARTLAMGLCPAEPGPAMVLDSLSHLLSVAQALVPRPASLRLQDAALDAAAADADRAVLRLRLAHADGVLDAELHLQVHARQPRPAWLAVDGRRMDRRIGAGYAIAFAAGEREEPAADPLQRLVAEFAGRLVAIRADDAVAAAGAVAVRLELYAAVAAALWPARSPAP